MRGITFYRKQKKMSQAELARAIGVGQSTVSGYENGTRSGKSVSFDENGNVVIKVWEDGELISEQTITDGE